MKYYLIYMFYLETRIKYLLLEKFDVLLKNNFFFLEYDKRKTINHPFPFWLFIAPRILKARYQHTLTTFFILVLGY